MKIDLYRSKQLKERDQILTPVLVRAPFVCSSIGIAVRSRDSKFAGTFPNFVLGWGTPFVLCSFQNTPRHSATSEGDLGDSKKWGCDGITAGKTSVMEEVAFMLGERSSSTRNVRLS